MSKEAVSALVLYIHSLADRVVASWAAGTARSRACVAIACMLRA